MHDADATAESPPDSSAEARLVRALGLAQQTLERHELALAQALAELGEIDLPDGAPAPDDAQLLEPLGPFYLAFQLEQAGLLRTAESVAGLFASGAITANLGAVGARILKFWQERRNRLTEAERAQLFQTVFEPPFERLMATLCGALRDHADNRDAIDWRERARLEQAAQQLAGFLAERAGGMIAYSARDIVGTLNDALAFLRERALQAAFSVNSLWALVRVAAGDAGGGIHAADFVDRGRSGQTVLGWLTGTTRSGHATIDPRVAADQAVIAAAERWLLAQDPAGAGRGDARAAPAVA